METKKLIIIGILLIIICILAGAIIGLVTQNTQYERIEIVPNGTSIDIPKNNANYLGDTYGVKFWNWTDGVLVSYNSQEGNNRVELTGALGFYAIKELVKTGNAETIEGITIYELTGEQLSKFNMTKNNDKFYCVHLVNDTTHDNIIICCKDKNILTHMVKSIQYKTSNSTNTTNLNVTNSETTITNAPSTNNVTSSNDEKSNEELPVSYYSQHPESESDYDDYDDSYYEDEYEDTESESSSPYESSSSASADSRSSSASSG